MYFHAICCWLLLHEDGEIENRERGRRRCVVCCGCVFVGCICSVLCVAFGPMIMGCLWSVDWCALFRDLWHSCSTPFRAARSCKVSVRARSHLLMTTTDGVRWWWWCSLSLPLVACSMCVVCCSRLCEHLWNIVLLNECVKVY